MLCRAITEIDSEGLEHPGANLGQGNGARIGYFPVKYDAARKKALYYWFLACSGREDVSHPYLNCTVVVPCCSSACLADVIVSLLILSATKTRSMGLTIMHALVCLPAHCVTLGDNLNSVP